MLDSTQNQGIGIGCPVISSTSFLNRTAKMRTITPTVISIARKMNSRIEESDKDNSVICITIDLSNPPDDGSAIINNSTSW